MRKNLLKNEHLASTVQIVLGCALGALAYPLFLVPNHIAPGGLTGLATVLNYLFHWPVGTTSLLMNIPLFIIGYRAMGPGICDPVAGGDGAFLGADRPDPAAAHDAAAPAGSGVRRGAAGRGPGAHPARRRDHGRHGYGGPHDSQPLSAHLGGGHSVFH